MKDDNEGADALSRVTLSVMEEEEERDIDEDEDLDELHASLIDPSHHVDSRRRIYVTNNKDETVLLNGKLMRKVTGLGDSGEWEEATPKLP